MTFFEATPASDSLERTHLRRSDTCDNSRQAAGTDDGAAVIQLHELGGLYLVCAMIASLGMLLAASHELSRRWQPDTSGANKGEAVAQMLSVQSRRSEQRRPSTSDHVGRGRGADGEALKAVLSAIQRLEGSLGPPDKEGDKDYHSISSPSALNLRQGGDAALLTDSV